MHIFRESIKMSLMKIFISNSIRMRLLFLCHASLSEQTFPACPVHLLQFYHHYPTPPLPPFFLPHEWYIPRSIFLRLCVYWNGIFHYEHSRRMKGGTCLLQEYQMRSGCAMRTWSPSCSRMGLTLWYTHTGTTLTSRHPVLSGFLEQTDLRDRWKTSKEKERRMDTKKGRMKGEKAV